MFESTKVVASLVKMDIVGRKARSVYGYGNENHSKKESRAYIYRMMQKLCNNMIKGAGLEVEVIGKENLPKEGPVVYMANHRSVFDVVLLASIVDDPCIFIGKKEVARMPLIHKWFDAMGCLYIDREDKRQSLKCIMEGIKELKEGQSVVIFPEGTRSRTGAIASFKEGSFKLATKANVPLIPIAFYNTESILEKQGRIKRTKAVVNIGTPINTALLTQEEAKELPRQVEDTVKDLLKEIIAKESSK